MYWQDETGVHLAEYPCEFIIVDTLRSTLQYNTLIQFTNT